MVDPKVFRVCADPRDMPYSNTKGEGFENKIAGLLAKALHKSVAYTWYPNAPGFVRKTLALYKCDIIMGVPQGDDNVQVTNPYYNIHRLGFFITPTPRAADVLLVAGPGTDHMRVSLQKVFEAMPAPKLVFAIGSCAGGGGLWYDTYSVLGPVEKVLPVDFYIPGCPPRPEAILYGVAVAAGLVDKKVAPVRIKQLEFPIPKYHPEDLRVEDGLVVYQKLERV